MAIHDLHLNCIAVRPDEVDAKLVVDPDTVFPNPSAVELAASRSFNGLKPFAWFVAEDPGTNESQS
jgi:hypothetical protein